MKGSYVSLILGLVALSVIVMPMIAWAQVQPPTVFEIQGNSQVYVDESGSAHVREEIRFSAEAFVAFKQTYNPLSTFLRDLKPRSHPSQLTAVSIEVDEANNKVIISYTELGAAVFKGDGLWALRVAEPGEKLALSSHDESHAVFTRVIAAGDRYRVMETVTVNLPKGAKYKSYDADSGVVLYTLPLSEPGEGNNGLKVVGVILTLMGAALVMYPYITSRRVPVVKDIEKAGAERLT